MKFRHSWSCLTARLAGFLVLAILPSGAVFAATAADILKACLERDGDAEGMAEYRLSMAGQALTVRGELKSNMADTSRDDTHRVAFYFELSPSEFLGVYGFIPAGQAAELERGRDYDVSGVIRRIDRNLYGDSENDAHRCDGTVWLEEIRVQDDLQ
jgi:hypothetical protein